MQLEINNNSILYKIGLLILVIITSLFVLINDLFLGIASFTFSIIIFIIIYFKTKRLIYKKLFFSILLINTIYMIIGNLLFSPSDHALNSYSFFIFTINTSGFENGVIGALKRNSMIILSFAWLISIRNMEDVYNSLTIIPSKKYNKYLNIFLKLILNQKNKLQTQFYSLNIRGIIQKSSNIRIKLYQANLILKSLFNRFFYDIGKLTYAGECHFGHEANFSNSDPQISLYKVSVRYESEKEFMLKNVDLAVNGKSFIILAGENKAGKTTLLRVLSGYIPNILGELYGSVNICGVTFSNALEITDIAVYVKYIMDDPEEFIIGLTVKQEILLHTINTDFAFQCLKLMKIDHLWYQETSKLSGGELVRLVLASLLASKAKIILLDSVLSQLDCKGRVEFIDALSTFYKNNNCIIIVADYYIELFIDLAERYIVLEAGLILFDGIEPQKRPDVFSQIILGDNDIQLFTKAGESKYAINQNQPIIQLINISKGFDNNQILKEFNLTVRPSDRIAITGLNGCGKTTAMLILAGILVPDNGERIVYKQPFNLGFVFQNANYQIVGTTIIEELSIGPKLRRWSKEKIDQFTTAKSKYLLVNPKESTLALHPNDLKVLAFVASDIDLNLMIFDEPTIFMDSNGFKQFQSILNELDRKSVAVIIISHNERIIRSCSQIITLS